MEPTKRHIDPGKIIITLILCVAVIGSIVAITVSAVNNSRQLDTPELVFMRESGIINWDAISNAGGYRVVLDETTEFTTIEPTFTLPTRGLHVVKVVALPKDGETKLRESKPATIEVKYTTMIADPDVTLNRYNDGAVKYVINNFDKDSKEYVITIADVPYKVSTDRGVIKAGLAEGQYDVIIQGIGDDIMTIDSNTVSRTVNIKPVVLHKAEYVTKTTKNDFTFTLDTKGQDIVYVVADLYEIDNRSYIFDKTTGGIVIKENILLSHATDEPQMIEVYYKDGNMELIEITITDNRLAVVDEYLSIRAGSPAKFSFDIYRNTLVGVEIVRTDNTRETLVEGTGYEVERSGLKATIKIMHPNPDTDKEIVLKFEKTGIDPYEKVVKYYFREAIPEVYNTHITYNKALVSRGDVLVKFAASSNITRLDMFEIREGEYTIDNTNGIITIKSSYLDSFDNGAIVTGRVYFGSDSSTFTIHVIEESTAGFAIATLDENEYNYQLKSGNDVKMTLSSAFRLNGVSFDGVKIKEGYGHNKSVFTLNASFLDQIGAGRHEVRLHIDDATTYDVVAHVNIDVVDFTPSEISVSIDNTYPELAFSYKNVGEDVETYVTNIRTGNTFSNVSGEHRILVHHSEFVSGDKYTISHVRGGETKTSPEIIYNSPEIENDEKYYNAHFTYGGEQYDAIITSGSEFETLIHYMIMRVTKMRAYDAEGIVTDMDDTMLWSTPGSSNRGFEYALKVKVPFINAANAQELNNSISKRINEATDTYKEPNSLDYKTYSNFATKEVELLFRVKSAHVPYAVNADGHEVVQTQYSLDYEPPFKTEHPRASQYDDFKINNWEKTQKVFLTDEIYYAIEDGARPVPVPGSPAEEMLNIIKDVNRSIMDDSMSDTEKYMAIFDWIVNNVSYDQNTAIYEGSLSGSNYPQVYPRRCFFLEGVFVDHIAVCNGLAKAVVVMAGLEGIESLKVLGYTGPIGLGQQRHAWIKVKLDGTWYNSDPTWGSQKWTDMPKLGELVAEGMNHNYTLVADATFEKNNAHRPDRRFEHMISNIDFNYFANVLYGRSEAGEMNSLVINSTDDIVKAVEQIKTNATYLEYDEAVAIPVLSNLGSINTKMTEELRRQTGIENWTVKPRIVESKHGAEYKLLIFTKTK